MAGPSKQESAASDIQHPVLIYDGVCGLCHRTVRFVGKRDPEGLFHFATLQGEVGREILIRHHLDPEALDSVVLLWAPGTPKERTYVKSRAVLRILRSLGLPWNLAVVLWPLPSFILDPIYALVARLRYRIFGKHDTCSIPAPELRARFLDP